MERNADGVFGAIVVKPKQDLNAGEYDHDLNEHIILLNDWFDETIISKFAFNHHGTTDNDRATGILINGKGVDLRNEKKDYAHTPRALFHVKSGSRYRFRLINAGVSYCPILFMIDNHTLSVVASDGHSVKAESFEAVVLHAGIITFFIISCCKFKIH